MTFDIFYWRTSHLNHVVLVWHKIHVVSQSLSSLFSFIVGGIQPIPSHPIPSHPRVPKTRASGCVSAPTSDHSFSNRQRGPSFPKITWTGRGKHVALSVNSSFFLRCYCSVKSVTFYASVRLTYILCYLVLFKLMV